MKWEDILKDEESYSHQLGLIERLEKLLENLYDDIEEQAIKMNKETGYPVEEARKLIKNLQKDIINETEKTINRMRQELPRHIREWWIMNWEEVLKKKKSTVNQAGNYTKPTMRKRIFNRIKAGSKGGAKGQWSARKAQMLAQAYKKAGGGYRN